MFRYSGNVVIKTQEGRSPPETVKSTLTFRLEFQDLT